MNAGVTFYIFAPVWAKEMRPLGFGYFGGSKMIFMSRSMCT